MFRDGVDPLSCFSSCGSEQRAKICRRRTNLACTPEVGAQQTCREIIFIKKDEERGEMWITAHFYKSTLLNCTWRRMVGVLNSVHFVSTVPVCPTAAPVLQNTRECVSFRVTPRDNRPCPPTLSLRLWSPTARFISQVTF